MRGKGQRIRLDVVSDPAPKVSRILRQVMYFEGLESVLRSSVVLLENVESCVQRSDAAPARRLPGFLGEARQNIHCEAQGEIRDRRVAPH
jgi:hypothetical protein